MRKGLHFHDCMCPGAPTRLGGSVLPHSRARGDIAPHQWDVGGWGQSISVGFRGCGSHPSVVFGEWSCLTSMGFWWDSGYERLIFQCDFGPLGDFGAGEEETPCSPLRFLRFSLEEHQDP